MASILGAPAVESTGTGFVVRRDLAPHPARHEVRDFRRNSNYLWALCIRLARRNPRVQLDPRNPSDPGMAAIRKAVRMLARVPDELLQSPSFKAVAAEIIDELASEETQCDEREHAPSADNRGALLRLFIGIFAAVYLMLLRVRTTLTWHPDAPTLVLVMLATCLRYGRRDEPDDLALLPRRPNQRSLGSCPQS